MRKITSWLHPIARVFITAGLSHQAAAQDRAPAATGSSESAAFQPLGLTAGGFRIYPAVRFSVGYDDAVARINGMKEGDGLVVLAPSITGKSSWSTHQLVGETFYRSTQYIQKTQQNHDEYGANLRGLIDVTRFTKVTADANYSRLAEQRGSPGDLLLSNRFILFNNASGSVGISQQFNRILVELEGRQSYFRYEDTVFDGQAVPQKFRNRNSRTLSLRTAYQISSITSLIGYYSRTSINYDITQLLNRSSSGHSLLTGVKFEPSQILRGEINIGYIAQNFDDKRFSSFKGLNYSASLNYKPTQLTTVTLNAGRRLSDSALSSVAGVLTNNIRFSIEHELLRNLILQSSASYTNFNYRGIDRKDNRLDYNLGARYKISQGLSVAMSGSRVAQDSGDVLRRRFNSNRGTLSLIVAQ